MRNDTTSRGSGKKYQTLQAELNGCRQAEETLRKSQYYLDRIISGMFECFVVVDRNFVIKDVNNQFLEKYCGKRKKVIGRKCYEVTHGIGEPCSHNGHRCPVKEVFNTAKPTRVEHIHRDEKGEELIVEIYSFPLFGKDGNVEHVVEVHHDVTKKRRIEEERTQRKKLEGVLEMAGAICHELSQPLQALAGHSELLGKNLPEDHPEQKRIAKILSHVDIATETIEKLRNITRYETKDYVLGTKIIDIERASKTIRYEDDLLEIAKQGSDRSRHSCYREIL